MTLTSTMLRTFVPGGPNFDLSKRFYVALGFALVWETPDLVCFRQSGGEFLLQNYYSKDWADNFMMQLVVEDLDGWWAHIDALDLKASFGVRRPKPPAMTPWGLREIQLIGPAGECWHIAQASD